MNTHHNIHLVEQKVDLKVTYRDGKFLQVKKLRGPLDALILKYIGYLFPLDEKDFDAFIKKNKNTVVYTAEAKKPKTEFTKFMDAWNNFYKKDKGIYPKVDVAERVSLTKIIKYLKSINNDDEKAALTNWQIILDNWKMLPEFYQKKADLKKINSNFNVIITELTDSISKKTGASHTESRKRANNIADEFF